MKLSILALLIAAAIFFAPTTSAQAAVRLRAGAGISLKITAASKMVGSGYPVPLHVAVVNGSRLPLWFLPGSPGRYFMLRASGVKGGGNLTPAGRLEFKPVWGGDFLMMETLVYPGHSASWSDPYPAAWLHDLSIPGIYRIRLVTRQPVLLVSKATITVNGPAVSYTLVLPKSLSLGWVSTHRHPKSGFGSVGAAVSNFITLKVLPPDRAHEGSAFLKTVKAKPPAEALPDQPCLWAVRLPSSNGLPIQLYVYLRSGKVPLRIRLTGDPLVDFRDMQVDGPDGINGDELIKKTKPYNGPIPNWKPTPFTAYGKWLAKNPPMGFIFKTYKLRPGTVYQYAVPLNLACRFDMTVAGNYHVRLRLAHSKIRSAWTNVNVPFITKIWGDAFEPVAHLAHPPVGGNAQIIRHGTDW